jgi:hypothetical protein
VAVREAVPVQQRQRGGMVLLGLAGEACHSGAQDRGILSSA